MASRTDYFEDESDEEFDFDLIDDEPKKEEPEIVTYGQGFRARQNANGMWPCPYFSCGESFTTKTALDRHKSRTRDPPHEYCERCDRDLDGWEDYQMHIVMSPLHFACAKCYKEFQSDGGQLGHEKQMHRENDPISCPGCGQGYANASGLTQHIEGNWCTGGLVRHVLAMGYKRVADKSTKLGVSMAAHSTSTHGIHALPLPAAKELAYHLRDQNDAEGANGENKTVTHDYLKYEHQRNLYVRDLAGSTIMDYTGDLDDRTVADLKRLTDNVAQFWDEASGAYHCPHPGCKRTFAGRGNNASIEQHLTSSIHANKFFRCYKCLDRFKSGSALMQHQESKGCLGNAGQANMRKIMTEEVLKPFTEEFKKNENKLQRVMNRWDKRAAANPPTEQYQAPQVVRTRRVIEEPPNGKPRGPVPDRRPFVPVPDLRLAGPVPERRPAYSSQVADYRPPKIATSQSNGTNGAPKKSARHTTAGRQLIADFEERMSISGASSVVSRASDGAASFASHAEDYSHESGASQNQDAPKKTRRSHADRHRLFVKYEDSVLSRASSVHNNEPVSVRPAPSHRPAQPQYHYEDDEDDDYTQRARYQSTHYD